MPETNGWSLLRLPLAGPRKMDPLDAHVVAHDAEEVVSHAVERRRVGEEERAAAQRAALADEFDPGAQGDGTIAAEVPLHVMGDDHPAGECLIKER